MPKKILIVDDYDDLRTVLEAEFTKQQYAVRTALSRKEGLQLMMSEDFDVVVTDLDGEPLALDSQNNGSSSTSRSNVKAFKISFEKYRANEFSEEDLGDCIKTILNNKSQYVDRSNNIKKRHEKIEFEVPSTISVMHSILEYLMNRVDKLGVVSPEKSNLFIALDEAFVNAVKHGNKFSTEKNVRINADITPKEARFTVEDEGEGFDVAAIPDPTDVENLFKTSGRGVMFMYNIMDEVIYNDRGNRITMVKKRDNQSSDDD